MEHIGWLKQQWFNPWGRGGLLVALFTVVFGITFGIVSLVQNLQQPEPEETAIAFYKAAWIENDVQKAQSYLVPDQHQRVKKDITAVPKLQLSPGPLVIGQTSSTQEKEMYLYRSDIGLGVHLVLRLQKGKWIVTDYRLDSSSRYSSVKIKNPKMEWEEIKNP